MNWLNRTVARIFTLNKVDAPRDFLRALEEEALLPWVRYTEILFGFGLERDLCRRLRDAHVTASETGAPRLDPLRGPRPAMTEVELQARDGVEFAGLLETIKERAGLSYREIGAITGIRSSQVHSMITRGAARETRGALPTRPAQVEAVLRACGLPDEQVTRVMELYAQLRERKRDQAAVVLDSFGELERRHWLRLGSTVEVTGPPGWGKSTFLTKTFSEFLGASSANRMLIVLDSRDQSHSWIRRLEGFANGDDDPPGPLPAAPRRT